MSDKPEALRLADIMNSWSRRANCAKEAAAELRRLHAECDALRARAEAAENFSDVLINGWRGRAEKAEAERDALRAEVDRLTTPNLYWIDGGESQVAEELCELADNIASDISGDARECTVTVGCARELPSMQMRVWIDDEGSMDYDTTPLPNVKEAK